MALGKEAPWPPPRRRRRRRKEDDESESEGEGESESESSSEDEGDAAAAAPAPPRISLSRSWHAGDIVHDLCFHPLGGADDHADREGINPNRGCLGFGPPLLAVATRDHPVHLLGPLLQSPQEKITASSSQQQPPQIVASFVPLDQAVEPATTTAMCFTPDGGTLALGGQAGSVALFDVSRPGRTPRAVIPSPSSSKRRKSSKGDRSAPPSFGSGGFGSGNGGGGGGGGGVPLQFGKRRQSGRSYDSVSSSSAPSSTPASSSAAPLTHCPLRGGSSMVSSLACSSAAHSTTTLSPLLAVGFVSGAISVADPRTAEVLLSLEGGHEDAVTTLAWSPCGWYLYSAARRDGAVRCWDVRRGDSVLPVERGDISSFGGGGCALSLSRASRSTQQRIEVAVEPVAGRHLLSGGEDGWVRAFDLRAEAQAQAQQAAQSQREGGSEEEGDDGKSSAAAASAAPPPTPSTGWRVSKEAVAAVAIHPWLPLVAAGSGCRRRRSRSRSRGGGSGSGSGSGSDEDDDDDDDDKNALPRAALSFWRPGYTWRETARNIA